jgi:hypothetical protein
VTASAPLNSTSQKPSPASPNGRQRRRRSPADPERREQHPRRDEQVHGVDERQEQDQHERRDRLAAERRGAAVERDGREAGRRPAVRQAAEVGRRGRGHEAAAGRLAPVVLLGAGLVARVLAPLAGAVALLAALLLHVLAPLALRLLPLAARGGPRLRHGGGIGGAAYGAGA